MWPECWKPRLVRLPTIHWSFRTKFGGGAVISGGNFHGAPLSYAFDYAALAMTDLAGITERRIDRLLNPDINEGLPRFCLTIRDFPRDS